MDILGENVNYEEIGESSPGRNNYQSSIAEEVHSEGLLASAETDESRDWCCHFRRRVELVPVTFGCQQGIEFEDVTVVYL